MEICKYCGEKLNRGHHCSGKKAYEKGIADTIKEFADKEKKENGSV